MSTALKQTMLSTEADTGDTTHPEFITAKEITLLSRDGDGAQLNDLTGKYKAIVNADKVEQIFNIVGAGYKILQHEEMYSLVRETVKELGFKTSIKTIQMNEGARLRMVVTFPDIFVKIGPSSVNDVVTFRMSFDNSYDATTGLRTMVDGVRERTNSALILPDNFAHFYHRHTKGMDANNIRPTIVKGNENFLTKVKEKWEKYYLTKIDPNKVKNLFQELHDDKFISQKYLMAMLSRLSNEVVMRGMGDITNQWSLYNLVSDVMNNECDSMDVQENAVKKIDDKINSSIKDLIIS